MQNKFHSLAKRPLTIAISAALGAAVLLSISLGMRSSFVHAENQPEALMVRQGPNIVIPANSPLRQRISVVTASQADSAHAVELPAQVEANPATTVNILPPLTGKVVALKVGLGDRVKKGQPLLVIASGDFAQAASDQQKARDALQLAKRTLERQRGVQQAGAGAQKDLEAAESAYEQALYEFNRADTRVHALGDIGTDLSGRGLTVFAPVSGSITALSIGLGQNVNDATASVMTISNLDSVWVTANVPENMLSYVSKGQSVKLSLNAYPDAQFKGKVSFISDVLQPDTRRSLVRIALDNKEGKLKPNMYATASFPVPQAVSASVPTSALLMNNDSTTLFVEVAPWTFTRRTVETGFEDNGQVRILSGVKVGERVIGAGGVLLND
ncbi:cobalt-zinc-cadmium efflux system membrane fusion protein [Herbaspirillum sp. Sphag1AN]|uniref:efflux RND transporter periplasmic adaptor subunit n=1 Tax=unclassified Herbaspirillum TaxID=2624150 RepID=UPI00160F5A79|nr:MULTISPECIES: efflux RND transporter periplasmic adaptor subunit [unclassified Herbaspirillum]MBB3214122.1 cobalt-zinc-cadmium efflux system membrane fusion protein [Herbaspirillum sp. Sphag1AN]MBB3247791.1 cobalt-zinc-cadmium efflux system membrane fusion protein [Herbaspirillum sp. Sphag64]